jgi:hypothetical protein
VSVRTGDGRVRFLLGSERETPLPDRQLGLQKLQEKNRNCEHVVLLGDGAGAASLAVKMRGQDVCPHCTRREAAYWRERAKTAEGLVSAEPARSTSEPAPQNPPPSPTGDSE